MFDIILSSQPITAVASYTRQHSPPSSAVLGRYGFPLQSLTCTLPRWGGERQVGDCSLRLCLPSVVKAPVQGPPRALLEVDRLRENPENGGQRGQWRTVKITVQVSNNTNPCPGLRVKTSTVVVKEDSTGLEQRQHKRIRARRAGTS